MMYDDVRGIWSKVYGGTKLMLLKGYSNVQKARERVYGEPDTTHVKDGG